MLRLLGFGTLVLIAVCLALSASIALADNGTPADGRKAEDRTVEAIDPDRRDIDESLASGEDLFGAADLLEI